MDLVNYQDRERTVYVVSEMEYLPGLPDGYRHAQDRVVNLGACDGDDGRMAGYIHPATDRKKFTLSGKKDIEILDDGYLVGTCKSYQT
jgi:hypothetical protein